MNHWARTYIDRPWARNADGPQAFSCWGLVRHVFRERHGIEFPAVAVDDGQAAARGAEDALANVRAIKRAARAAAMRRLPAGNEQPAEDDIVVMSSAVRLHCGLVVKANGRLGVLHSQHQTGVIWEPWSEAIAGMKYELWRRSA